jgi:hypothetical protein
MGCSLLLFSLRADAVEANPKMQACIANGVPYGVGQLDLSRKYAIASGWQIDRTIELSCSDCKVWFATLDPSPPIDSDSNANATLQDDRMTLHFLFSGPSPRKLEMKLGKTRVTVPVRMGLSDPTTHQEWMESWWQSLCRQSQQGISPTLQKTNKDFLHVLATHLGLVVPAPQKSRKAESTLESQLERTIGKLLGFESVRLALMTDDLAEDLTRSDSSLPLPSPVGLPLVNMPAIRQAYPNAVESIARAVPQDCFYVRCKSIENYLWLRQIVVGWGGSLGEIIATPTLDGDLRGDVELQLGINPERCVEAFVDRLVSDVAIVGSDIFFGDGAGVGVVFESLPDREFELDRILNKQRAEGQIRTGAASSSERVDGHPVSIIESKDHRMRSFFIRRGRYAFVTNSRDLMHSFIKLDANGKSLADLTEYRASLASLEGDKISDVRIYLSDPFFRRVTGPAFRTELTRRRIASQCCQRLEIAALIASSLGHAATSRQSLIDHQFLPADFGLLSDESSIELVDGKSVNTVRGIRGAFIPIPDVPCERVSRAEYDAYTKFASRYRKEWPAMDPVLVAIDREATQTALQRVRLRIHVTPYARQAYAFLSNYLSEPSSSHIQVPKRELVSLTAHLRQGSRKFVGHLGIADSRIPFEVKAGQLRRTDNGTVGSFHNNYGFAAVTPGGIEGLQLLNGLMESLQSSHAQTVPILRPSEPQRALIGKSSFQLLHGIANPLEGMTKLGESLVLGLADANQAALIDQDGTWSVYSKNAELRATLRNDLQLVAANEAAQIHFHAGGLDLSSVKAYWNAYCFCDARQQSGANAAWLTRWMTGMQLGPRRFLLSLEKALDAKLICPLGGSYIYARSSQGGHQWISTAWREEGLESVSSVPPEYEPPFLAWLRQIDVRFRLSSASLDADVNLLLSEKSP